MPLSAPAKSRIALFVLFAFIGYLLNYMLFRPVALTSDGTSTYYLDSIKVSATVTGVIFLLVSAIGLTLSWWLITC